MKFSEILLSEFDEYGIPVFIYFAHHENSIACIRCVFTKEAYAEHRLDDLDIES
jgi:cysteinyl-tRNA synthetase